MDWNEMRDSVTEYKKRLKGFAIKNTSTGKYVCDEFGRTKIFSNTDDAKMYIKIHHLTSMFEICDVED